MGEEGIACVRVQVRINTALGNDRTAVWRGRGERGRAIRGVERRGGGCSLWGGSEGVPRGAVPEERTVAPLEEYLLSRPRNFGKFGGVFLEFGEIMDGGGRV